MTRDGKSILAAIFSGDLTRVQSLPRTGSASRRTLFTTTSLVRYLDTGPDGCIYADQVSRPTSLVRFASSGATVHKQSSSQSYLYMEGAALLPNGRLAMTVVRQGRRRLMVIEPGRDPVPLANTAEETATPATAVGLSEVAFMIVETKPKPHREVAIASLLTGRIIRRVAFDKGEITSLAATPDGKMLYCAANGVIWSVPSTSGEPRKIRTGDPVAVDPEGKYLLVQVIENPATRLVNRTGSVGQRRGAGDPIKGTIAPDLPAYILGDDRHACPACRTLGVAGLVVLLTRCDRSGYRPHRANSSRALL